MWLKKDLKVCPLFCYIFYLLVDFGLDLRQSHTTIATVEKITEGIYLLKALKQKLWVDGLCYLLQEIYGIENKNNEKVIYFIHFVKEI